jgi:hypothetical protein
MRKAAQPKSAPVAKQIRFSELVKKCGRPETVTLWTTPEDNPPFMKAVRENRVLTLLLKPHGNHPDVGEIAFHQRPNALYLVFARSLPEESGARVVGIKYDLLAEQRTNGPVAKAPKPKKRPKAPNVTAPVVPLIALKEKPKPIPPKRFNVTILRTASVEEKVTVIALNIRDAETGALQAVKKRKFRAGNIDEHIKAISEI